MMGNKKISGRPKKRKPSGIVAKQKKQDGGTEDISDNQPSRSGLNTSASKRKLSTPIADHCESGECIIEGFVLVDVIILCEYLSRTAVCEECKEAHSI